VKGDTKKPLPGFHDPGSGGVLRASVLTLKGVESTTPPLPDLSGRIGCARLRQRHRRKAENSRNMPPQAALQAARFSKGKLCGRSSKQSRLLVSSQYSTPWPSRQAVSLKKPLKTTIIVA
jgi:hypothetical protein